MRRSKIPADQQRVISEIGDTANRDGLGAWKYTGELAAVLGVQSRTVTNARRAGVDAGFLTVTREPPRGRPSKQVKSWTTEYRLTIPDEKAGTCVPTSGEKAGTQIPTFGEKVGTQIPASVRSTHEIGNVDSTPSGSSSGFDSGSARVAARAAGAHAAIVDELLHSAITNHLPKQTFSRLRNEAIGLLEELDEPDVLAAALRLWNERPDARPGLLPHLYSDVVRDRAAGTQSDSVALEAEARRAAIPDCPDCDEFGQVDLGDSVATCRHPNLRRGAGEETRSA